MSEFDIKKMNQFVTDIQLLDIKLISASAEDKMLSIENADSLNLTIKVDTKLSFDQQENNIIYKNEHTLKGMYHKKVALVVKCEYWLFYKLSSEAEEQYIKMFGEKSVILATWPYFREYVSSMVSQMGHSKMTLPLIKR